MPLQIRPLHTVEEARPTVTAPTRKRANRTGYVPDIPRGGTTGKNPVAAGSLKRSDLMDQLYLAYLNCQWVSACIDVIAKTCTAGGVTVVPNSYSLDNPKIPQAPPEVEKVKKLLQNINPQDDARQLFRTIISDLLIFGDSYTEVTYLGREPLYLWHLSPTTMEVNANEHGIVTGYTQTMDTGRTVKFKPNEVIHVKLDSPRGGLYGVSPTEKTLMSIQAWLFTMALVTETMRRGDPVRFHVDWSVALTENDIHRHQQQFATRNLGAKNIGNPFETKGDTQVQEIGVNKIADWLNVIQQRRDEIISGFGVPPSKVSVVESGNIGGGSGTSQDKTFRVNTCGPLQELVLEKFTYALLHTCYGIDDWHLEFTEVDWRDDEVIEQIRDMRLRNGSWTLNRYRADINEPPVVGGNVPVLVDRQNLVTWKDMAAMSDANVQVLKNKASGTTKTTTTSGSLPGVPKGKNAPRTAARPTAKAARNARSKHATSETTDSLDDLYEQVLAYHENRKRILQELPE